MQLPKMLYIGGGVSLVLSLFGGFFAMPKLINNAIKEQKGLKEGSMTREMWSKLPFPLTFKIYLFNVTNAAEVQAGGTPVVDEIGPYIYDEFRAKVELKDRNLDDTLTFRPQATWFYNQARSGALTGDEIVTVPNVLLLGIVNMVERDTPATLAMVNKAFREIFNKPDSIYVTVPVRDILFDGVLVNCSVTSFGAKAICAKLEEKAGTAFKKVGDKLYKFSMFGMKNGTAGRELRVKRGIKNATDVGRVIDFEEKTKLDVWRGDHCNTIAGTDGTIFGPFLAEGQSLTSFAPDLCRSMDLVYVKKDVHRDVPVFHYKGGFGDIPNTPIEHCYCISNTSCPRKGTMELSACAGSPITASMPHFYDSDAEYIDGVKGMRPNQEKHEIRIDFEPITGTPVQAASRLQFNMEIHTVAKMDMMKTLKTTMHPILWLEESIMIPDKILDVIKKDLLKTLWLIDVVKWATLAASVLMLAAGRFLQVKAKEANTADITPVQPYEASPAKKTDLMVMDNSMIRY